MMTKTVKMLAAASALAWSGVAGAATLTQTLSYLTYGPVSQNTTFDMRLGTLNSVTLAGSESITFNYVVRQYLGPFTVTLPTTISAGIFSYTLPDYSATVSTTIGDQSQLSGGYFSLIASRTFNLSLSDPVSLAAFETIGARTGSPSVYDPTFVGATPTVTAGAVSFERDYRATDTRLSATLTYDFTPFASAAVPEPASWAMMMVGLLVTGAALRRRRDRGCPA